MNIADEQIIKQLENEVQKAGAAGILLSTIAAGMLYKIEMIPPISIKHLSNAIDVLNIGCTKIKNSISAMKAGMLATTHITGTTMRRTG